MRQFEDALLECYIAESEPSVREIDRSALDLIKETNRFKKETREAKKRSQKVLNSSRCFIDPEGDLAISEFLGGEDFSFYVDPVRWLRELKIKLESGVLHEKIENILGLSLDYSPIGVWEKRHLKWQTGAQVLWFDHPKESIDVIKKLITAPALFELLNLDVLPSMDNVESRFRDLENWIRPINPRGSKVGRPPKNFQSNTKIAPIPLIFNSELKIKIRGLRIVVDALTKVLKVQKKNKEEVFSHCLFQMYRSLLPQIEIFIDLWVEEAFSGC